MGNKRLYGVYIYNILIEYATAESKLSVKNISDLSNKIYGEKIDEVTIQRYINSFKNLENHTLLGNWKEGFCLINNNCKIISNENKFYDDEIELLITLVRTTKRLKTHDKTFLIDKLSNLYDNNQLKEYYNYLILEKNDESKPFATEKNVKAQKYLFYNLVSIINEQKPIILEGQSCFIKNGEKFNCYAFMPQDNNTILVGTYNGISAVFISLSSISSFKVMYNEKFIKTPLTLKKNLIFNDKIINFIKTNYPDDFIINEYTKNDIDKKIKIFNDQKQIKKDQFFKEYYIKNKMSFDYNLFSNEEIKQIEDEFENSWKEQEKQFFNILLKK